MWSEHRSGEAFELSAAGHLLWEKWERPEGGDWAFAGRHQDDDPRGTEPRPFPSATPKPSTVRPAGGHASPRLAQSFARAPPRVLFSHLASSAPVAGLTGGKSPGEGGTGSALRVAGFHTACGSGSGSRTRMFLEPQVGL